MKYNRVQRSAATRRHQTRAMVFPRLVKVLSLNDVQKTALEVLIKNDYLNKFRTRNRVYVVWRQHAWYLIPLPLWLLTNWGLYVVDIVRALDLSEKYTEASLISSVTFDVQGGDPRGESPKGLWTTCSDLYRGVRYYVGVQTGVDGGVCEWCSECGDLGGEYCQMDLQVFLLSLSTVSHDLRIAIRTPPRHLPHDQLPRISKKDRIQNWGRELDDDICKYLISST
ncbi:hypothetical protein C8J57DRAFT_1256295 [Mycena rebaudengoi]|nr:hypothetical protein C8J57DRAFT_1256295 [Mycena rebaudengoi]